MNIKVIHTLEEMKKLENLRYEVLNITQRIQEDNFYIREAKNKRIIPFALYYHNDIVAGAYISSINNSIYIDYIFVKDIYQNTGLRLGRTLLEYILNNKEIIEEFFDKEFYYSYLEPIGEKQEKIFEKIGYRKTNSIFGQYKKRI